MRKCSLLVVLVFVFSFSFLPAWGQSTFTVDRLTDTGEGEGLMGDLRYCITNATSGEDVIIFEVRGTINLTGELPTLNASVSIEGPGADLLTVRRDTGGLYGIFTVGSDATVLISGLTISNGNVPSGVVNNGTLTLSNSTISGNTGNMAGGIFNNGTLIVSNSTVSNNDGSGIVNEGTLTVNNSTVSGNLSMFGGGIANYGTMTLSNSTVSGNEADREFHGGGIFNFNNGTLTISNSTISNNVAGFGGGIHKSSGILNMRNTILAGNGAFWEGFDLFGRLTSSGYNLIGNTSGGNGFDPTDLLNVGSLLGPLQDNGGPTLTHALLAGSPAIDAGDNTDAPRFDQRGCGFPRIVNGNIDIGAYEVQFGPSCNFNGVCELFRGESCANCQSDCVCQGNCADICFPGPPLPPECNFCVCVNQEGSKRGQVRFKRGKEGSSPLKRGQKRGRRGVKSALKRGQVRF